jgi:hypothetical protein
MMAFGKLKAKVEMRNQETKRFRKQAREVNQKMVLEINRLKQVIPKIFDIVQRN